MKNYKRYDSIFFVAVLAAGVFFNPSYILPLAYILIAPYLIYTKREALFDHLIVASTIALIWMMIAKDQYGYNQEFISVAGINLFALFAWALGLFGLYAVFSYIEPKKYWKKLLYFSLLYIPLLLAVETIAYHVLNIHNVTAATYPGLPLCDCIHAPHWMQAVYILLGPLYLTIIHVLKLKNPN